MLRTAHGLGAFALISLGVAFTRFHVAGAVIRPRIRQEVFRAGVQLLPMVAFLGIAMGVVVIGQAVSLLSRVGATEYLGVIMATVVVRELGPFMTALIVLARIGTITVVELGTSRAMGEVEALEALSVDPVHYLVLPRLIGIVMALSALTIYLILVALVGGYAFAFLQDLPIGPGEYFSQLAGALQWQDFALLALKTAAFGIVIAIVSCYHGLARPLRLEEVGRAATRAVVESVLICTGTDALFILVYLLT